MRKLLSKSSRLAHSVLSDFILIYPSLLFNVKAVFPFTVKGHSSMFYEELSALENNQATLSALQNDYIHVKEQPSPLTSLAVRGAGWLLILSQMAV